MTQLLLLVFLIYFGVRQCVTVVINEQNSTSHILKVKIDNYNGLLLYGQDTNVTIAYDVNKSPVFEIDILNELLSRCKNPSTNCYTNTIEFDTSNNAIQQIPVTLITTAFKNLLNLNLSFNLIDNLKSLKDVNKNLQILDLSNNKISKLDINTFVSFAYLEYLSLKSNLIKDINLFTFYNTVNLVDLNLSENYLTETSLKFFVFSNLSKLRRLNLNFNNLTTKLNVHLFKNLNSLESVSLAYNQIPDLDLISLFKFNKNLKFINLSFNKNLITNQTNDANTVYDNVVDLNLAGLSMINLESFEFLMVFRNVQNLNLSLCEIGKFSFKIIDKLKMLSVLDLSNNHLMQIDDIAVIQSTALKYLNLSGNLIQAITSLPNLSNLLIDLRFNSIKNLKNVYTAVEDSLASVVLLEGNELVCDCDVNSWWTNIHDATHGFTLKNTNIRIEDYEKLKCSIVPDEFPLSLRDFLPSTTKSLITNTNISSKILCKFQNYCSKATCECCSYYACDCNTVCPKMCTCFRNYHHNQEIITCELKNLTQVQIKSVKVTHLYLNNNTLTRIRSYEYFSKIQLKLLDLSYNQISFIDEYSFYGLRNLNTLKLNNNKLIALLGYEFQNLLSLEYLYLNNNNIKFISINTFENLKNLKILNLINNKFQHIIEPYRFINNQFSFLNTTILNYTNILQAYTNVSTTDDAQDLTTQYLVQEYSQRSVNKTIANLIHINKNEFILYGFLLIFIIILLCFLIFILVLQLNKYISLNKCVFNVYSLINEKFSRYMLSFQQQHKNNCHNHTDYVVCNMNDGGGKDESNKD